MIKQKKIYHVKDMNCLLESHKLVLPRSTTTKKKNKTKDKKT